MFKMKLIFNYNFDFCYIKNVRVLNKGMFIFFIYSIYVWIGVYDVNCIVFLLND